MLKVTIPAIFLLLYFTGSLAQKHTGKVGWQSPEQVSAQYKQQVRPIIIDVYTDWCAHHTVMDRTTWSNPEVAAYISERFYAVKRLACCRSWRFRSTSLSTCTKV